MLSNLTEVASDDDSGGFYTSQVKFNCNGGTTYSIKVDGAYGASGKIILNATQSTFLLGAKALPQITVQPTNQVTGFGGMASFSVQAAGSGNKYQWYFNDVPLSHATNSSLLIKSATNSCVGFYTVAITASTGTSTLSKPASLQINLLDGAVNTNTTAFDKFQADFLNASNALQALLSGTVILAYQPSSSGMSVTDAGGTSRGYSSTQVFSTYGGGTQSGEPFHCGDLGGDSAWTSVQAADNGVMEMDTDGTTFNTVLAVYTGNGSDFSSLTPVACDVGSGQGGTNSMVSFAATSNTVYYVAVDGVSGQSGTVVLHANLNVPPAITTQPASQTVAPGSTITLNAAASGSSDAKLPMVAQWQNGCRCDQWHAGHHQFSIHDLGHLPNDGHEFRWRGCHDSGFRAREHRHAPRYFLFLSLEPHLPDAAGWRGEHQLRHSSLDRHENLDSHCNQHSRLGPLDFQRWLRDQCAALLSRGARSLIKTYLAATGASSGEMPVIDAHCIKPSRVRLQAFEKTIPIARVFRRPIHFAQGAHAR